MTASANERLKILQMLDEEKITAEEAATLLRAMEGGGRRATMPPRPPSPPGGGGRFLRIRVTDMASGTGKVNVTIPIGLVSAGLRIAERFAPEFEGLDLAELEEVITSGVDGKIVEVMDAEDNEMVEIYVE
jgi:hypothetical protein